ncbi:hypothetical protein A4D02_20935 [Niastella koreensis]|uniref:Fibronectin type III domain protein n=2 Tax=Niastella koreensis TaxID=354356 RepID=G8TMX6_NIAKG|nr:T9SS type A sorting domain-containing protein [Niastella koreensis]AEV96638.1 Fibronectin type III domain protein [Niastella koreensis GR20-10]OQP54146.1 hypothetical protein A4D02_20935 [Niastella koreensis]
MKRLKYIATLFLLGVVLHLHAQRAFTAGNIVVYRVGDGSTALTSGAANVYLDEYTPAGVLIQSILMPASGQKINCFGDDVFGGQLSLSTNGKSLIVPGLNVDLGVSTLGPRSIGVVDYNGAISSITVDPNASSYNMRSAVSNDGTNLWAASGGSLGVEYTTVGSATPALIASIGGSSNSVGIANGQLYASSNSNSLPLVKIGTGLPTTTGQTVSAVPGIPTRTRPQQFAFADLDAGVAGVDVLYLASQNPLVPGGIQKYSLVNGTWVANGQVGTTADAYSGLTIKVSGSSVTIYATRQGGNNAIIKGGELVKLVDNGGYNTTLTGTPTVLAAVANANTAAFRGVALVPQPAPFTAGNIVVYRVGDGSAALTSGASKIYLDEYTPAGVLVQSILMPASGQKITCFGDDVFGGQLSLSTDGKSLIVPGLNVDLGMSTLGPRSIGVVDYNGAVTSVTVDPNAGSYNMRSAVSNDGTNVWVASGGSLGVEYTTVGSATPALIASIGGSSNTVGIADGQLYASSNSNSLPLVKIGTGLPATTGQIVSAVPGIPTRTRPQQFAFADLDAGVAGVDVLYLASQNPISPGGIQKYSLVNGTWVANGQVGATADAYSGLTIKVSGNSVTIYATRQGVNNATIKGGELVKLVDNSGYNSTLTGTPTVLAAVANVNTKALRGVALVPQGCFSPLAFQVINVTATQATLTWNAPSGGGSTFEYAVTTSATPPATGTTTNTTLNTVTGLSNAITYYAHVRTVCGAAGKSEWASVSFVTSCKAPLLSRLNMNPLPTGKTTINWNQVFGAAGYEYVVSQSATPPATGTAVSDTFVNVEGLSAVTSYYVHVRSGCGPGAWSGWISKLFTTGCFMPTANLNVMANKAGVTWNKINNAIQYEYALTATAAKPLSGVVTADTSYVSGKLNDGPAHYFHVRSICSTGAVSEWNTVKFNLEGIEIYPNPVTDILHINLHTTGTNGQVSVTNAMGGMVARVRVTGSILTIDTRGWAAGLYLVRYDDGVNKYVEKIIKK